MAADSGDDLDYMLPSNCSSPYFDTWDRHNSIAFSATKGLRNAPGENNCFVNCAVQAPSDQRVTRPRRYRLSTRVLRSAFPLGWCQCTVSKSATRQLLAALAGTETA
ncbi:hypothetical protein ACOMHN_012690 [Nucella lapillus]